MSLLFFINLTAFSYFKLGVNISAGYTLCTSFVLTIANLVSLPKGLVSSLVIILEVLVTLNSLNVMLPQSLGTFSLRLLLNSSLVADLIDFFDYLSVSRFFSGVFGAESICDTFITLLRSLSSFLNLVSSSPSWPARSYHALATSVMPSVALEMTIP